ncbi:unnamed protein product [Schistosoma margrebowiei]|uniref:Uncharacterized protein n=1 Tax=Schistosoma margrebowiei TaxID=48269 RepID=A0A183MWT3_9TREM|nr:unnamed protein product [Schistosoma margrebowiei]
MGWYWGPLSFQDAQFLLAKRPDGSFLVRDSGHDTHILSLSFRVRGETYHTRIEHNQVIDHCTKPCHNIIETLDRQFLHDNRNFYQ